MGCSTEHHVNIEMSTCLVTECALRGDRYLSMVLWLGGLMDVLCFIMSSFLLFGLVNGDIVLVGFAGVSQVQWHRT
ncbi:unnamed protein product [Linum trigynum]|uniref:Uncharacterized protein n=1 Tax=Linum trigynum TaxID=586398 RepID=A0AAV2FD83_9ROSI